MSPIRVETRSRARALQAIYAWDVRTIGGNPRPLPEIAAQVWDDLHIEPEERKLASRIVRSLADSGRSVDQDLQAVTTNWRLERLGAIDRSVLRLAAAELSAGDTPPRVVLQEAVKLAERYGGVDSARFVNGVLDALAHRMGLL